MPCQLKRADTLKMRKRFQLTIKNLAALSIYSHRKNPALHNKSKHEFVAIIEIGTLLLRLFQ